ncbi:MAG TPA: DUF58 domain-containing protein [Candidatus Avipropionibacterium avicola]|uniref:DUF58 domain-containing protein n=1 Tax=Candidatus Avipropionibacterium avicola TaxID=2840701 RepID=A0A9D1H0J2_9ACTN|nr:DUF58 domain-containing protein [Candidatus Avipropionibacterium avicola]
MRAWRILTGRGRALLLIGLIGTIGCALVGERDVMVVPLLLFFVPVVAAVVLSRSRLRLSCERSVHPNEVSLGGRLTGELVITHRSRIPVGVVLLEDDVPAQLGQRPRFMVDSATQDWHRRVSYPMVGHYRGRFHTGPLRVRLTDPFGLVTLDRAFTTVSELLVTPRVHLLESPNGAGGGGQSGDDRPHRIGVTGQDDVLVREYHDGDDVRRIHWRSTARRGEMMVRREEQAWDPTCAILLDNRSGSHTGDHLHGSFEWAVSFAASVGDHFISEAYSIEIYHGQGRLDLAHVSAQRNAVRHVMLRGLAEITTRAQPSLSHGVTELQADAAGQLLVAVLGRVSAAEAALVAGARRNRARGIAVVMDVDTWDGTAKSQDEANEHLDRITAILESEQWLVVRAEARDSVPEVWSRIAALQAVR